MKRSQVYPDAFVRELLLQLRGWIQQHQPHRFGAFQVLAAARPTLDPTAWDNVFDQVTRSFSSSSSRRPYNVEPDSVFGKTIQDLFRMDAVRIQVVNTPTQRRFHFDFHYSARGAALQYNDGSRSIEVENLEDIQRPKQRFEKPVQYAVFMFGSIRQVSGPGAEQRDPGPDIPVPGLSTDITFPGIGDKVPPEVRRSVARLHTNLGHPSAQELSRLLCHQGVPSPSVLECVRKLHCATCKRLAAPQHPRPAALPSLQCGQFGDTVQGDFFWVRLANGENVKILGLCDTATGFHQAGILQTQAARGAFDIVDRVWLRPYGLPARFLLDPDPLFQGDFDDLLSTINVKVEFCPAEAHWMIGAVERRNAVLRTILEKMINDHSATTSEQLDLLITGSLHAINTFMTAKGRSPFQAVFGKVPQLPGGLFTDDGSLAETFLDPIFKAESVRTEALNHLGTMNVDRGLRRALLRKTQNTKVPDLQPGQRCAFWRWRKRGLRKRGAWTTGKFLSWDPEHPEKQAWVKTGTGTLLVATEQLRAAVGFEEWTPDEQDIAALRDAATDLKDSMWSDERGPGRLGDEATIDDGVYEHQPQTPRSLPPTPFVPAAPSAAPAPPRLPAPVVTNQATTNVSVNLSPTFQRSTVHQHFGDPVRSLNRAPRTPRTRRSRSPAPAALRGGQQQQAVLEDGALYESGPYDSALFEDEPAVETNRDPAKGTSAVEVEASATPPEPQGPPLHHELQASELPALLPPGDQQHEPLEPTKQHSDLLPSGHSQYPRHELQAPAELHALPPPGGTSLASSHLQTQSIHGSSSRSPTEEVPSSSQVPSLAASEPPLSQGEQPLPTLPAKQPFDTLTTLLLDGNEIHKIHAGDDYYTGVFGPQHNFFYYAHLASSYRLDDVPNGKSPRESDTSDSDSGHDDSRPKTSPTQRHLSRQELKALDREIPWTQILKGPNVNDYLQAITKEALSWQRWKSVEPLSHEQVKKVLADKVLCKRILRARACYRDKARGQGPLRAKCRVVCLGHRDPDLFSLNRQAPTPNRTSEHVLFMLLVAGSNQEIGTTGLKWHGWTGDASTAFLQGRQQARPLPLYLRPPSDGPISRTEHWKAPLYRVCSNVYGLADAPRVWALEVVSRMTELGYVQHSFDHMVFIKRIANNDAGDINSLLSVVLVYVDDFFGVHRSDYSFDEVKEAFEWGNLDFFLPGKPTTFKGKELTLTPTSAGRLQLKITQKDFIDNLDSGRIAKGTDLTAPLTAAQQAEFRLVAGCLQWLAGQ